jgi:hypothetical protein
MGMDVFKLKLVSVTRKTRIIRNQAYSGGGVRIAADVNRSWTSTYLAWME